MVKEKDTRKMLCNESDFKWGMLFDESVIYFQISRIAYYYFDLIMYLQLATILYSE